MAVVVKGIELDVDVAEELEPHTEHFSKVKIREDKLQSCSPFRHEVHPSFAINLVTGTWIDSGAGIGEKEKGNLQGLLAYFEHMTYEEAEDYLLTKYKPSYIDVDGLELNIMLEQEQHYKTFSKEELQPYMYKHPYLLKRGISEKVIRAFTAGYDRDNKSVMFVWRDKKGNPVNLKFRSINKKKFYYAEGGQPIKNHIYGLHLIHKKNISKAFVTESEIDAMYLWSFGYPAIALGTASLSAKQEELIRESPIEKLIIATDNDTAGLRCRRDIIDRLEGSKDLYYFDIPNPYKDVNDIPESPLLISVKNIKKISLFNVLE